MIKSPREKFITSPARLQWEQVTMSEPFQLACDYALLQMQTEMPAAQETSFQSHQQMVGAQTLIRILKTIHEVKEKPQTKTQQGLNYQAGV